MPSVVHVSMSQQCFSHSCRLTLRHILYYIHSPCSIEGSEKKTAQLWFLLDIFARPFNGCPLPLFWRRKTPLFTMENPVFVDVTIGKGGCLGWLWPYLKSTHMCDVLYFLNLHYPSNPFTLWVNARIVDDCSLKPSPHLSKKRSWVCEVQKYSKYVQAGPLLVINRILTLINGLLNGSLNHFIPISF